MSESLKQPVGEQNKSAFEGLEQARALVERAKDKVFYTGIFVDREELYDKFPAQLENPVEAPHITANFAPDETQLHLDELGSGAKVYAIGYGNDGKNEGILVKVEADDPVIQKAVDAVKVPHITLSCSDDSHPMYTSKLAFSPLEEPVELTKNNRYCVHLKDDQDAEGVNGPLIESLEELKKYI